MIISVTDRDIASGETLILFVHENPCRFPASAQTNAAVDFPWLTGGPAWADCTGKAKETMIVYPPDGPGRVILAGLGPVANCPAETLREAVARAVQKCRDLKIETAVIPVQALPDCGLSVEDTVREAALAAELCLYRYTEFKTRDMNASDCPKALTFAAASAKIEALTRAVATGQAVARGVNLARDLSSAPANQATPAYLTAACAKVAEARGLSKTVISYDEAKEMGMGGFCAVAQGSANPGAMVILEYAPAARKDDRPLVLVGKGVTFDTGGITLKPGEGMEKMKRDMAGAAAVLGTLDAVAALGLDRRVIGIMPFAENMPDGNAFRPGDILRTLKGLTVEVISTDAEGRLLLCDALTYAARFNPSAVIDIATLTGACVVALGEQVAGLMGNDESLTAKVHKLSLEAGERTWPLPLWDIYNEAIKSDAADLRNIGNRKGGAIHAGAFLANFVPENTPWVHVDIAGPAWIDKDTPLTPKGASGFGVRLLFAAVAGA